MLGYVNNVSLNFVFREKVCKDFITCLGIHQGSVLFKPSFCLLLGEMSSCDFFLRKFLKILKNLLIRLLKKNKFIWCQSFIYNFFGILIRLFPFRHWWVTHKYLFGILISFWIPIQNISPIKAVILRQSPFITFVNQLIR